jgi:hypothetical protein
MENVKTYNVKENKEDETISRFSIFSRPVVLMVVTMLMLVLQVVMLCGLVGRYQHFGVTYYLLQP